MFRSDPEVKLNETQPRLFQKELTCIEQEKSSTEWSRMFLHSRENKFLYDTLMGGNFTDIQWKYPEPLAEAFHRSPQTLTLAASQWKEFTNEYFGGKDGSVPGLPLYVEIQECLGINGGS